MPIVVGFLDEDGNEVEFSLDCDRCWARLRATDDTSAESLSNCLYCGA